MGPSALLGLRPPCRPWREARPGGGRPETGPWLAGTRPHRLPTSALWALRMLEPRPSGTEDGVLSRFGPFGGPEAGPGFRLPGRTPDCRLGVGAPTARLAGALGLGGFSCVFTEALASSGNAATAHGPRRARAPAVSPRAPEAFAALPSLAESGRDCWGLGPQPPRGWQCAASGDLEDDHLSFN